MDFRARALWTHFYKFGYSLNLGTIPAPTTGQSDQERHFFRTGGNARGYMERFERYGIIQVLNEGFVFLNAKAKRFQAAQAFTDKISVVEFQGFALRSEQ